MTIIFIVLGCLLIIAAVALLVTAWVIGVAAAVSMFYIGYEAWNAPDTCRGFCSVFLMSRVLILCIVWVYP